MDERKRKDFKIHFKKDKKLKKLISVSESDSEESEHELSHYLNDRVKLMKEALKIIKPKKMRTMAPNCMKNLDQGEINSILLEELLGISNKRLEYIFNGEHLEEDSSSTDPEVEQEPIDVISLDDISDNDFIIDLDSENDQRTKQLKRHKPKIKQERRRKKIKKEKQDKSDNRSPKKSKETGKDKMDEQNLMSVLELLELQARARAIRSQLALESSKKSEVLKINETAKSKESDNDDAIIIESPKNIEIIITSSESENECSEKLNDNYKSSKKQSNSERNGSKNESNDLNKHNIKETESLIENIFNEQTFNNEEITLMGINNDKSINSVSVNKNNDDEETLESKDNKTESMLQADRICSESRNKLTNIETVIITSAKNIVSTANTNNEFCDTNKNSEKKIIVNENVEQPVTKNAMIKNEKPTLIPRQNMSKVDNYDESDGIIINMEQSEIDCIISD